tara:strand:- start:258 stop:1019 length:762 start_codon:yes stop_codon:yes gene_type:complete
MDYGGKYSLKKAMLNEAGAASERQERGLIDAINAVASPDSPVEVRSGDAILKNVVGAGKREGMSALGKEPYTDVEIYLADGTTLNVSAKGDSAPSLAGGGLRALNMLLPDLVSDFLQKAVQELLAQGYQKGDLGVSDVYGKISDSDSLIALRGNEDMGGPIDYMYQGPMDVTAEYGDGFVTVNGRFSNIEDYAESHTLYLRARKRRNDQPFDPDMVDKAGLPSLFGRSPSKKDSNRRIVVAERAPSNAIIVEI